MSQVEILRTLLENGELDRETVENLRDADRDEMERMLSSYLPDSEVAVILGRIDSLIAALEASERGG
jgi:hypothetical protein